MISIIRHIAYALFIIIGSYLLWYFSIIIHEVGHLIAALINGHRFISITVGPVKIYRAEKGLKISFFKEWNGLCQTVPEKDVIMDSEKLNRVTRKVILAGPISNVIFALLLFILIFVFFGNSRMLPIILSLTLAPLVFTIYSFKIEFDGGWSDIAVYSMLKSKTKKEVMEACLRIHYLVLSIDSVDELERGTSIKNINSSDIDLLLSSGDVRFEYLALWYAYEYYKAIGNIAKAEEMKGRQSLLHDKVNELARSSLMIHD